MLKSFLTVLPALLISGPGAVLAHNHSQANLLPVAGITIDGDLDDWPADIARHPITWVHPGWDTPEDSKDVQASFAAGFSPEVQRRGFCSSPCQSTTRRRY